MSIINLASNIDICKIFGIDPNSCTGFNLRVRSDELPRLTIQRIVVNGGQRKTIMQKFEIKPLEEPRAAGQRGARQARGDQQ